MNILHVPTIMKNLVLVDQIVQQSMQVIFNNVGCFIEKEGRLITRGQRDDQMFILDSHKMKSAMFAKKINHTPQEEKFPNLKKNKGIILVFSKNMDNYFIFIPNIKEQRAWATNWERKDKKDGLRFKYYINGKPYTTRGKFEHIIEELNHCI